MDINTKYDINDLLWTVDNNKVMAFRVSEVTVSTVLSDLDKTTKVTVKYHGGGINTPHLERECFRTRAELINWLADPYGAAAQNK